MAKILTGGGVSAIRGSIAGNVFSVNANGAYIRNRGSVSNRNTDAQQAARANLSNTAQAWRGLTDAQRNSWSAGKGSFPYVDKLGISSVLTGFQLFQKLNQSLLAVGAPSIATCPVPQSIPSFTLSSCSWDLSTGTILIGTGFETITPLVVPADVTLLIELTPVLSEGVYAPKRPLFKSYAVLPEGSDLATELRSDNYFDMFGNLPTVGQRVFIRAQVVSNISGERSSAQFLPIAVVA